MSAAPALSAECPDAITLPQFEEPRTGSRGASPLGLLLVLALVGFIGCWGGVGSARAADLVWSGQSTAASWSDGVNWGGSAPASGDTLDFPALTSAACTASPQTETCYQSNNDESGLTAAGITIDDGAGYDITGNALTLGAGGLTAAPSGDDPASEDGLFSSLDVPITLGASQTWTITGGLANQQLLITGALRGPASDPLSLVLHNDNAGVTFADAEVGAVTLIGDGTTTGGFVKLGYFDDANTLVPGALNATDGSQVTVTAGAALLSLDGTVGPLTGRDGLLQVGQPDQVGTLTIKGNLAFDAQSGILSFIGAGTVAGTDYSQITSSGNVNLGDATLSLVDAEASGGNVCELLTTGDIDTLISASGGVSGTFDGIPNVAGGTTVPLSCPGSGGTPPTVNILYTANAVTATVVTPGTAGAQTTTTLAANPTSAVTNQPVTLTANVTGASAAPVGTVAFYDNTGGSKVLIPGCAAQGLDGSGNATCQTSFASADAPELSAVYSPADGSPLAGSTSPTPSLVIAPAPTSTALTLSAPTTTNGNQEVVATATVSTADAGETQPTGTVDFEADGAQIPPAPGSPGCQAVALDAGTLAEECEILNPGGRAITANYSGDANFLTSTSPSTPSPVTPPTATTPGPAPAAAGPPPPTPAGAPVSGIGRATVGRASVTATTADVILRCTGAKGQHCTVTLKLSTRERTKGGKLLSASAAKVAPKTTTRSIVVGTRTITLDAGLGEVVHVSLNAAGKRALTRLHKLPVTLTATEKTSTGSARPTVRKFTFRRPADG